MSASIESLPYAFKAQFQTVRSEFHKLTNNDLLTAYAIVARTDDHFKTAIIKTMLAERMDNSDNNRDVDEEYGCAYAKQCMHFVEK